MVPNSELNSIEGADVESEIEVGVDTGSWMVGRIETGRALA